MDVLLLEEDLKLVGGKAEDAEESVMWRPLSHRGSPDSNSPKTEEYLLKVKYTLFSINLKKDLTNAQSYWTN